MAKRLTSDDVERLDEIKSEIVNLADEALRIVSGTDDEDRARGYPFGRIRSALDGRSNERSS